MKLRRANHTLRNIPTTTTKCSLTVPVILSGAVAACFGRRSSQEDLSLRKAEMRFVQTHGGGSPSIYRMCSCSLLEAKGMDRSSKRVDLSQRLCFLRASLRSCGSLLRLLAVMSEQEMDLMMRRRKRCSWMKDRD